MKTKQKVSREPKKSVRVPAVSNPKKILRELDKLSKYRNGVKCNKRDSDRYGELPSFTGHLLFKDVIKVITKLAGNTALKKTEKPKTRKTN